VTFGSDGRTVLTSGAGTSAMVWDISDLADPRRLSILTGHSGGVESVAVGPDRRTAMTGGGDAAILWDVSDPVKPHRMGRTAVGHAGLRCLLNLWQQWPKVYEVAGVFVAPVAEVPVAEVWREQHGRGEVCRRVGVFDGDRHRVYRDARQILLVSFILRSVRASTARPRRPVYPGQVGHVR